VSICCIGGETVEIEYQYRFGIPRAMVWKDIKNEQVLKKALSGCKSFAEISTGLYLGEIQMNVGPIQDLFKVEIKVVEELAPSLLRLKLKGKGNLGQMNGEALLMFTEVHGVTQLALKAKGELSGALGLAGNRLLDGGATKGIDNFFQQLEKEIKRKIYERKRRNK
jgi:carbon monoxide dehydrogenase subunit G